MKPRTEQRPTLQDQPEVADEDIKPDDIVVEAEVQIEEDPEAEAVTEEHKPIPRPEAPGADQTTTIETEPVDPDLITEEMEEHK